ncbi:MAG: ABC transporter permease, partial [Pseudomonadota bacterium]
MTELWFALPAWLQDMLLLVGLLLPIFWVGWLCLRGYRLWPLLSGLLRRHAVLSLTFTLLIAISVGIGVGVIAQERGLREGSARSAEKFDMIVAAPGSEMTVMLASVYLEPTALPLLDGEIYDL